ncbi:Plastid lipid-associated protein/fibrillin conserved domain-containing protein [Artemisia annua]|uniref:Plastid lipid-associated protein/fibrillin conserved domain-containing protein n=1 Tax=Artemisia annua TaxID=35608 RepID=A0A2U1MJP8_ARTAN|nr:Plastid lipid-associated protein/fibrillin conserved domain-containing protein [Artemisia annua]
MDGNSGCFATGNNFVVLQLCEEIMGKWKPLLDLTVLNTPKSLAEIGLAVESFALMNRGKNVDVFGTAAGDVLQVINVENKSLNNVITFPPDGKARKLRGRVII